ncbi:hypothetical protein KP509_18G050000 [Ceratopteris richardii]|uniref:Nudix hydrolase domain-containing protein n=1 Tax=Ceratopteris richardii TaxID=49495 RepID=A0A8T2SU34_CERRI|nr:hypothetical protein KP509_18G050000 [Ceratopteris richardii]
MTWAIVCLGVTLASVFGFLRRRLLCRMTKGGGFNMSHGFACRAHAPSINRYDASFEGAIDGWRTLELWKLAEQRRALHDGPSDSDDVSSNIGLPRSVAMSNRNLKLAFSRSYAAVLVGLFQNEHGEIRVILTKRSQTLSSHSGEVALPGGKRDQEDVDDVATALREAKEEIGLDPSLVKVLTTIEPFITKKLLRVTPVIGLITEKSNFMPIPNPGEVDAVFDVPLEMFLKDQGHRCEDRKWLGFTFRLHFFEHEVGDEKFLIWGLTASILVRCASFIYRRPPEFEKVDDPNHPGGKAPRL